ncbi:CPBP family intramembrane metalloprotease [bacterium]|nr:CPBP family intramembrane metalloprotease [bacterium]
MEEPKPEKGLNSFWLHDGELRLFWKMSSYFTVFIFLFIVLYSASKVVPANLDWRLANPTLMAIAAGLATAFLLAVAGGRGFAVETGLLWYRHSIRDVLLGIGIAALMVTALLGLELLLGEASISSVHLTTGYAVRLLAVSLVGFTLVGVAEELLFRGYPFSAMQRQGSTALALIVTSVLFSLMHGFNPEIGWLGFMNIFLAGIWLGAARIVTGTLWLAIGLHIGWNFFLGSVYGFPVSGIIERSIFVMDMNGTWWIGGGQFGPEGGILSTLVLIGGTAVLMLPAMRSMLSPGSEKSEEKGNEE